MVDARNDEHGVDKLGEDLRLHHPEQRRPVDEHVVIATLRHLAQDRARLGSVAPQTAEAT